MMLHAGTTCVQATDSLSNLRHEAFRGGKNMFQDSRWLTYKNGDNPATSIISESNQHGFTPIQVALPAEQW